MHVCAAVCVKRHKFMTELITKLCKKGVLARLCGSAANSSQESCVANVVSTIR